jgi:predicted nucleotidyltransferase
MNKEEAVRILKENKKYLAEQYGVVQIGLFGSLVMDKTSNDSDIDITIEMKKEKKNLHNFLSVKRYLEQKLGRRVDLGFQHVLKPAVKEAIESTIIYV